MASCGSVQSIESNMTIVEDHTAPLVVVTGATGVQGGRVVRDFARSEKSYRVRGLTRELTMPAAQVLASQGVEVYAATIASGNEAAVKEAYKGGDVIFVSVQLIMFVKQIDLGAT